MSRALITDAPTLNPPNVTHTHNTNTISKPTLRPFTRLLVLLCAAAAVTQSSAVSRKSALKNASMLKAAAHLKNIKPAGLFNTSGTYSLEFELESMQTQPDEMSLTAALLLASLVSTDPTVIRLIKEAVATEIHKVTEKFDTVRELTSTNPMESDAFKVFSLMFIRFKTDGRVTARLAGCGNQQSPDSYSTTYAPTSDHPTFALTVAAYYANAVSTKTVPGLIHASFDVPGAFLQERLPRSATGGKQLVMRLPHNLPHRLAGKWVEVVGAIYGLKQSNAIFAAGFTKTMATIGFTPAYDLQQGPHTAPDAALFHYSDPLNPALKCTVPMHVDDGQVLCTCPLILARLKNALTLRYGEMTWSDVASQHCGTTITRYPNGAVAFDMTKHIIKMLHKLGMDKIPPALTPSSPTLFHTHPNTTPADQPKFQRIVGDLTYVTKNRHDINKNTFLHATKTTQKPTQGDFQNAIRTLRYLKAFPDTKTVYHTTDGVVLCGHVDASHANQENGTSTTCLTLTIGPTSAPFYTKTFAQDTVALDPCTAEYYGLAPLCKHLLRYRNLLAAIGFPQDNPSPIYMDNQPAIDIALASNLPRKSRYIEARHHFVREQVQNRTVCLRQRNTNDLGPDLNTKNHGPTLHHHLTSILMNTHALPPI